MVRKITADLHAHSTASDGELSPSELVAKAQKFGLKVLALTDHDTIDGLDEALDAGLQNGFQVIPGVEVSLRFRRPFFVGSLHLLLYFSNDLIAGKEFRDDLSTILKQGRGMPLIHERVRLINMEFGPGGKKPVLSRQLTTEEISSYGSNITRRHFALTLKEKHGIDDPGLINEIIGNDSPAYVPSGIDMELLKPFFQKYPVVRIFAHPAAGSFPEPSHYREVLPPLETVEKLLPEFLDKEILGINGLEIFYPGHTKEHREILSGWAKKYGLLITGGSDYHDDVHRPFGVEGMTQEELDIILQRIG